MMNYQLSFYRDCNRRQRELTNDENIKGKYHVRIMMKDNQENATYGLGHKLTLTRKTDNAVLGKNNAINIGKIKFDSIEGCIPHYTPSISNQAILSKQFLSKTPTELQYVERYVFLKEVKTQAIWTFELGTQEVINVPIWIIVGFQQRERQDPRKLNNDTFYRHPVTSAQCTIGSENEPDSTNLLTYNDNE